MSSERSQVHMPARAIPITGPMSQKVYFVGAMTATMVVIQKDY